MARKWLILPPMLTILLIAFEIYSNEQVSNVSLPTATLGLIASGVYIFAFITICVSVFSVFKVQKAHKLVPLTCTILALSIFCWAFFVSSFSGYGS